MTDTIINNENNKDMKKNINIEGLNIEPIILILFIFLA